ncbi:MAG: orotate phosphoribosyltransferase [Candidatus Omnitrophica bacterium]|nr:orotate phosphoribosyltransferase [Candidatus Omnitrophota bacterium]MCK5260007.1 orotate phosphoribosyltransferase [Candidatus Omnitrophota bacterium]
MMEARTIEDEREELRQSIIKDAYFREKITLSSGKESGYYIDARLVTLSARGAYLCARIMLDMVAGDNIDAIGGPTLGADPMIGAIAVLSLQADKPLNTFIIRKSPKAHGKQQQVEGPPLKEGDHVVLIDDVATTGKAFIQSIDVLRKLGIHVDKAICIVDRGEGAAAAVAEKNCELVSVFDIKEIHSL